jgi:hypothetical protein
MNVKPARNRRRIRVVRAGSIAADYRPVLAVISIVVF